MREDDELTLADYVSVLRRRWVWLVVPILVVVGAALAAVRLRTDTYSASAEVLIRNETNEGLFTGATDASGLLRRTEFAELVFARSADLASAYSSVGPADVTVTAASVTGTDSRVGAGSGVLRFTARSEDAQIAARAADHAASEYIAARHQQDLDALDERIAALDSQLAALRSDRADARSGIDDADERVAGATGDALAAAITDRNRIARDLEPQLDRLDSEIRRAELGQLDLIELREAASDPSSGARTISPALVPQVADGVGQGRALALALLAGVAIGIGVALARHALDTKVDTLADVAQRAGRPGLATYPAVPRRRRHRVASEQQLRCDEASRSVVTSMRLLALPQSPLVTVAVTSPGASDGKSFTALSLARAYAGAGDAVLIVDVDLPRPSLHETIKVPREPGVTDVLAGHVALDDAVRRAVVAPLTSPVGRGAGSGERGIATATLPLGTVDLLPAGTTMDSGPALVATQGFATLLKEAKGLYQVVILDCPPLLPVAMTRMVVAESDAVILVASHRRTRRVDVDRAVELLDDSGEPAVGVTLNRAPMHGPDTYGVYR